MMNQQQLKYAKQRVDDLYSAKKTALRNKFTIPGVCLTEDEKLEALRKGEYEVTPAIQGYGDRSWHYRIHFPQERPTVVDKVAVDAAEKELKATYRKLMDELMLGDNEQALQLIKEFEAA